MDERKYRQGVEELIEKNPHRERIRHLIDTPSLLKKMGGTFDGRLRIPNCHGTALWIKGIKDGEYPVYVPSSEMENLVGDYLRSGRLAQEKFPGAIQIWFEREEEKISREKAERGEGVSLVHSSIYLGETQGYEVSFGHSYKKSLEFLRYKVGMIFDFQTVVYFD